MFSTPIPVGADARLIPIPVGTALFSVGDSDKASSAKEAGAKLTPIPVGAVFPATLADPPIHEPAGIFPNNPPVAPPIAAAFNGSFPVSRPPNAPMPAPINNGAN